MGLTLNKLDIIRAGEIEPVVQALTDYDRQEMRKSFGTIE
jgi:hypothetical protein